VVAFASRLDAKAEQKNKEKKCIEIAHVGSEDAPVGALRLCIGEKGRSQVDSFFENKWTFYFDVQTYRGVEAFVSKNVLKDPADIGSEAEGSFSVTWKSGRRPRKYVLPPQRKCAYLGELVHAVAGDDYAEFRRAGWDMMTRERCPSPAK